MDKRKKINKEKEGLKVAGKFSEAEFFFDDCPICQAMKSADGREEDLSLTELRKVFEKANKKQKS